MLPLTPFSPSPLRHASTWLSVCTFLCLQMHQRAWYTFTVSAWECEEQKTERRKNRAGKNEIVLCVCLCVSVCQSWRNRESMRGQDSAEGMSQTSSSWGNAAQSLKSQMCVCEREIDREKDERKGKRATSGEVEGVRGWNGKQTWASF